MIRIEVHKVNNKAYGRKKPTESDLHGISKYIRAISYYV